MSTDLPHGLAVTTAPTVRPRRHPAKGRRVTLSGFAGQLTGGNGLAFGAAAGTLHPSADRPLSRPPGQVPRPAVAASRTLRGPSDRPLRAVLDPATAPGAGPTGRLRRREAKAARPRHPRR